MSRIEQSLAAASRSGRKSLIPYLVTGDPDTDTTVRLMHALVEAGADMIELGMPFSDPSSDGPVIQQAVERALQRGTGLADVLSVVARFRENDVTTPVVLMGYLNPLEIMGYSEFARRASEAGVDGVLVVDLPVSEADEWLTAARAQGLDCIFLVAPTTTPERVEAICERASGYLYYVSLKGVTGAAISDPAAISDRVNALRHSTDLPVMVGFGIKDAARAEAMARVADGIIVGSALVERVAALQPGADADSVAGAVSLIGSMRSAIDFTDNKKS